MYPKTIAKSLALLLFSFAGLACTTETESASGSSSSSSSSTSSSSGAAYTPDYIQVSYEAMPGAGTMVDYSDDPYTERAAFTAQIEKDVVPDVFTALSQDFTKLDTDATPGGYLLAVNPSLQTRVPEDWMSSEKTAAALGYVMYQWSVLLTDFTPQDAGNTGFGVVDFPAGTLDEKLAGDFFNHANTVDAGLGGGFFAFGDSMYFLNIADSQGMPYSGLTDEVFNQKLGEAATSFMGAAAKMGTMGKCEARFVENNWDKSMAGEDYAMKFADLPQAQKDSLTALQTEFMMLFNAAVTQYAWDMAPMPKIKMPSYRGMYGKHFYGNRMALPKAH